MSITLTEQERRALMAGEPVQVAAPELGEDAVLLRAGLFHQMSEQLRDDREQSLFRDFARKQASRLARENSY